MCWRVEYALLIVTSTLVDYVAGLAMGRTSSPGRRTLLLLMSLVTNLGLLFTFKYFNFFCGSLRVLFNHLGALVQVGPGAAALLGRTPPSRGRSLPTDLLP